MGDVISLKPNVTVITHNDLDGIGCASLITSQMDAQVTFLDYTKLDEQLPSLLLEFNAQPGFLFITDLSLKEDMKALLDPFVGKIKVIDHHGTSSWIADEPYGLHDTKMSATRLTHQYLDSIGHDVSDFNELVAIIDDYDMWGRGNGPTEMGKQWARVASVFGPVRMWQRFTAQPTAEMSPIESSVSVLDTERELDYIDKVLNSDNLFIDNIQGHDYVAVFADHYLNGVCSALLLKYPECEFVMVTDLVSNSAHLRGRGNLDLGHFAKSVGGGGHRKAAGFPLTEDALRKLLVGMACNHCKFREKFYADTRNKVN
jgi:oligoribonuclease NrnB/cAMP/cGMP phosphodiesterase (DHH superfamily)